MKHFIKTFISGVLAGSAICLGGFAFLYCKFKFGDIGHIIGSFLFPFGLLTICLVHWSLYTGKIGYIIDKNKKEICKYSIDLLIMLLGNLAATIIFGVLTYFLSSDEFINMISNIVINKHSNLFLLFVKSIICGMLVLLAVYLFNNNTNGFLKCVSIFFPIGIFVLTGMDHCIANMYYIFSALIFDWNIIGGLIITIIGNSIGSILLYSMIKYINKQD